jgi:hypothetical protein
MENFDPTNPIHKQIVSDVLNEVEDTNKAEETLVHEVNELLKNPTMPGNAQRLRELRAELTRRENPAPRFADLLSEVRYLSKHIQEGNNLARLREIQQRGY